jgi:hypothetical protein
MAVFAGHQTLTRVTQFFVNRIRLLLARERSLVPLSEPRVIKGLTRRQGVTCCTSVGDYFREAKESRGSLMGDRARTPKSGRINSEVVFPREKELFLQLRDGL